MTIRLFDLNVEDVLENWELEHALREIIANALDEQTLTNTREISIQKNKTGCWTIRDFGRGLRIDHFTLNENEEKTTAGDRVIGKFGVGLKDALATCHRRGIRVSIRSQHGEYTLRTARKHAFDAITTLHVEYDDVKSDLVGTEFSFGGLPDDKVARAKALFLRFADNSPIETTQYGQILRRGDQAAKIYILGVLAAEEPNFLFDYNITTLTESMRKSLNRERLHVGRSTYSERIRSILRASESHSVARALVDQVSRRSQGEQCDELQWIDISTKALNLMHASGRFVFLTEDEMQRHPNVLDNARSDGFTPIVITEQQSQKIGKQINSGGPEIRTMAGFVNEYNASFEYEFLPKWRLTRKERSILAQAASLASLVGVKSSELPEIRVSETLRLAPDRTTGVWDTTLKVIVVGRSQLASLEDFAATLLHELAHAISGTVDCTRQFEEVLSTYLGKVAAKASR